MTDSNLSSQEQRLTDIARRIADTQGTRALGLPYPTGNQIRVEYAVKGFVARDGNTFGDFFLGSDYSSAERALTEIERT